MSISVRHDQSNNQPTNASNSTTCALDSLMEPRPSEADFESINSSSSPPLSTAIISLFLWRDPVSSMLALIIGVLCTALVQIGQYTVLTIFSYMLLLQMIVCLLYVTSTRILLGKNDQTINQSIDEPEYVFVSPDAVIEYAGLIADYVNLIFNHFISAISGKNLKLSFQFMFATFFLAICGRVFDGFTLLGICYVSLFFVPKCYVDHQREADRLIEQLKDAVKMITDMMPGQEGNEQSNDQINDPTNQFHTKQE